MTDTTLILTVRMGSERLPGKAVAEVMGKPLTYWIIERLKPYGQVVLATTTQAADDELVEVARMAEVPCYRGAVDDVIGRMEGARSRYAPQAEFVMRALGDCPFLHGKFVERAARVMQQTYSEFFQWHTAPSCHPVYGAREFPYQVEAWKRVVERAKVREHVDNYFFTHRHEFCTVYHEPPPNIYFRPYRLEVDWPDDLELVRAIAEQVGMLAPLPQVITFLDEHKEVSNLNCMRVERTGLLVSYDYETQRDWMRAMEGKAVVGWNDLVWYPPSSKGLPVFCMSGQCLVGFALNGVLYTKNARMRGDAFVDCPCGAGRIWNSPFGRSNQSVGSLGSGSLVKLS